MTRQKNEIANGIRLENASWRTWWKQRNKLKTVSPETLNWSVSTPLPDSSAHGLSFPGSKTQTSPGSTGHFIPLSNGHLHPGPSQYQTPSTAATQLRPTTDLISTLPPQQPRGIPNLPARNPSSSTAASAKFSLPTSPHLLYSVLRILKTIQMLLIHSSPPPKESLLTRMPPKAPNDQVLYIRRVIPTLHAGAHLVRFVKTLLPA